MSCIIFMLLTLSADAVSVTPRNNTLSSVHARSLGYLMSAYTRFSIDKVIINVVQTVGININGYSYVPYKIQLLSSCSSSYENSNNVVPFRQIHDIRGTHDSYFRAEELYYGTDYTRHEFPPNSVNGTLCIKAPNTQYPMYKDIMKWFPRRIISFWFDLNVDRATVALNPKVKTGIVTFGGFEEKHLNADIQTEFRLQPFNDPNTQGWITKDPVTIRIQSKSGGAHRRVTFDIGEPLTLLPVEMYNALVHPGITRLFQPFTTTRIPNDVTQSIYGYAGTLPERYFPCKHAANIHGFQLNSLVIPNTHLIDRVNEDECILNVAPHPNGDEKDVVVGLHLIRRFHFQIDYRRGPKAIVSERRDMKLKSKKQACVIC